MLDPTLLLTAEEWREAEEPLDLKKPFIFVYMLGASSRMLRFATTLKKKTGMQLVFCPFPVGKPPISRWYPFISPAKWLWLMRNASYVVTNSFHGTAFSLNYEKKFFVDISDNLSTLSSRITRLLSLTGQENRLNWPWRGRGDRHGNRLCAGCGQRLGVNASGRGHICWICWRRATRTEAKRNGIRLRG